MVLIDQHTSSSARFSDFIIILSPHKQPISRTNCEALQLQSDGSKKKQIYLQETNIPKSIKLQLNYLGACNVDLLYIEETEHDIILNDGVR